MNPSHEFKKLAANFFRYTLKLDSIVKTISNQRFDLRENLSDGHMIIVAEDSLDTLDTYDTDESERLISSHNALIKFAQENDVNIEFFTQYTGDISSKCEELSELTENMMDFSEGIELDNDETRDEISEMCGNIINVADKIYEIFESNELQKFLATELISNNMKPKISMFHDESTGRSPYQVFQTDGVKIKNFKSKEIATGLAHQMNIEKGYVTEKNIELDSELAA